MSRSRALARPLAILALSALALTGACQGKSKTGADPTGAILPTFDPDSIPVAAESWSEGTLGYVAGTLAPDGTLTLEEPPRDANAAGAPVVGDVFDLDATEFFSLGPCFDCITAGGVTIDGLGDVHLPFTVRHPFTLGGGGRYDLHAFDVQGILISGGPTLFPGLGTAPINVGVSAVNDQLLSADPRLITNADGWTTHYDYHAENPAFGPPRSIPGNLNPYKRFFVDPSDTPFDFAAPSGHNVMGMGSLPETQEFIFSQTRLQAVGPVKFMFVVSVSYGKAATKTTRSTPTYFLTEFNRKEAWDVTVEVVSNTLQAGDRTSRAVVDLSVKDWQQNSIVNGNFPTNNTNGLVHWKSQVKQVEAAIPGIVNTKTTVTAPISGGGTDANPLVYRLSCFNELQNVTQGEYYGVVAVRDDLFQIPEDEQGPIKVPAGPSVSPREGVDIRDYSTYQFFTVTVGPPVDDPPIADLSLTTPRIVLSGTAVTLKGWLSDDDVGIVQWEYDPEGDGSFVDQTLTIPPQEFTFLYTTPVNTQTIYNAALRVTDTGGQSTTTSIPISVTTVPDPAPTAVITAPNPWTVTMGIDNAVTLDGAASFDPLPGAITKYEWDYGDGSGFVDFGLVSNTVHTYLPPGVTTIYNVQLRVTDTALQTHTVSRLLTVVVIDNPPVADLQWSGVSPGTDAPRDVLFDATASTDDTGWDPLPYRFDPGDGSGWSAWQASPTLNYQYIPSPLIDTNYTPRVEVKDSSGQTNQANGALVVVTVPGGCFVSGVTGPAALNVGESKNFSVVAVGLIPGGYQWNESDPSIQFVGPTNGASVTIQALAPSAAVNGTSFSFDGNGGTCGMSFNITVYGLEAEGPGFTEMYVNRPDAPLLGTDTDQFGTILPVTGRVVPAKPVTPITFNFLDPDEPQYDSVGGVTAVPVITTMEADLLPDDNRGDIRRPDGTAAALEVASQQKYQNGYEDPITPGIYVNQINQNTDVVGEAIADFKVSRMGGDNYTFSCSADPAGNGFQISATAPGTLTVWRQYASPVHSWWDVGTTNEQFYLPDFSVVNIRFLPMYVKWIFGTEAAPAAGCPPAYGGMDYMAIFTTGTQFGYVEAAASYNVPGELFTASHPNVMSYGLNAFTDGAGVPTGTIGLNSYMQFGTPPASLNSFPKPRSTRNYVGVARGRMNGFGWGATAQCNVFAHELGHALGLPHSCDDGGSRAAGTQPNTTQHGANGVGIMAPSAGGAPAGPNLLWTQSEVDFVRGIDRDLTKLDYTEAPLTARMRGPYFEGG